MTQRPELKYRPVGGDEYEILVHAIVPQDVMLEIHALLAQYGAVVPPNDEAPAPDPEPAPAKPRKPRTPTRRRKAGS